MITAIDLKIGDHAIFYDKDQKKNIEVIVRFINNTYCGLSKIGEKSCFLNYYKDCCLKKVI